MSQMSLNEYKRTKIIATVGPSTDSYDKILALIESGANGLRFNFSHGTHEERVKQTKWIRKAAKACGKPVAIILDLQGPKVRLGDFEGMVNVKRGQSLQLKYQKSGDTSMADPATSGLLPTQYDLSKKVKRGERIYMFDGRILTTVTSVKDGIVHVRVENDGLLIKRKGLNLPDTDFGGDVITEKDKKDLAFGSTQDIDYVAQSFVQTADDLRAMRRLMKNHNMTARLIVKFETRAAIDHMEEIVTEADMIMVARGDLGVEAAAESVPIIQRQLVALGLKYAKPTIVATQMLASMTDRPEPTRAEVSDVATAVLIGADCVMLSEETANGLYPIEAVKVMKRVIRYAESNSPLKTVYPRNEDTSRQAAVCASIIDLAEGVQARAIVAETKSGATARLIASRRPDIPLIAVTSDTRTAQQLALVYDVKSFVRPVHKLAAQKLTDYLLQTKVFAVGDVVVTASGQYPGVVGTTDTIKLRVLN